MDKITLINWNARAKRLAEQAESLRVEIASHCHGVENARLLLTAAGDALIGSRDLWGEIQRLQRITTAEVPYFKKDSNGRWDTVPHKQQRLASNGTKGGAPVIGEWKKIFRDAVPAVAGVVVYDKGRSDCLGRYVVAKVMKIVGKEISRTHQKYFYQKPAALRCAKKFLTVRAKKFGREYVPGEGAQTDAFKPLPAEGVVL